MDKEQEHLADTLRYYGMPEENVEKCVIQIAQGYGASRYLDGVANGADAVAELDEKIALTTKNGSWDGVDADAFIDEVRGR